jgi:DNA-binding response OmpR family regulator
MEMSDRKAVLVVEDDPEINSMVGAYVEISGFEYRSALDGITALKDAHEHPPSAVVLDLMLPDMDGFEVCKRLRKAQETARVPIIILSALSGEAEKQRGRACGADEYLTKPFDPEVLMKTMAKHAAGNGHT